MFSLPSNKESSDIQESRQLFELSRSFNSQAQRFKRQEIINAKRKTFSSNVFSGAFSNEDPDTLVRELAEIMDRTFNKSSVSNTHKNKNMKKILGKLRDILHGTTNEKVTPIQNFGLYMDLLITIIKNNPTDLLFEALRNLSLLTFHSQFFDSSKLLTPLFVLVEQQEKKLNMANANVVLEKALFSLGNLALESNLHHEFLISSKLHEILSKLMYRSDIKLLTTCLWVLSNLFRNIKEEVLCEMVKGCHLHKVVMHLFHKFNENSNGLLLSELLWMLVIISNNCNNCEIFEPNLIVKVTCFLASPNIKISVPATTILANLSMFMGENCLELIKNSSFQGVLENILLSNIYILKREIVLLLSNFIAVDARIAEYFLQNQSLMNYISNMFWELKQNNVKDDIITELCYFFINMLSHKIPNFGKILSEGYPKVTEVFHYLVTSQETSQIMKNLSKAFFSLL